MSRKIITKQRKKFMSGFGYINNYISTLNNIDTTTQNINDSLRRLSSGRKQVNAGDDVAATVMGMQLTKEIIGIDSAVINISAGTSVLEVASSTYDQIGNILNDMNALAAQAVSSTATSNDLINFNIQFQEYASQIDLIAKNTSFNNGPVGKVDKSNSIY